MFSTTPPDLSLRKRFKDSKCQRRKQQRTKPKRNELTEEKLDSVPAPANIEPALAEASSSKRESENTKETEESTGFNSEDEYTSLKSFKDRNLTDEEWTAVSIALVFIHYKIVTYSRLSTRFLA